MSPERNGSLSSAGARIPSSTRCSNRWRVASVLSASSSHESRQLSRGIGEASGTFTDCSRVLVAVSIRYGFVKRHRLGDSLEIELANLAHLKALGLHATNEVLAHVNAIRRRL